MILAGKAGEVRSEAEVDEEAAPVVAVLLDAVVHRANVLLVEVAQDLLLKGAGALTGDDLDQPDLLVDGILHHLLEGTVDLAAPVVDVVEVQDELRHG